MASTDSNRKKFYVELIKPSHYDDDGYVIQWWKSMIPSNSLSSVYGLALDAKHRQVLGEDVEIVIEAYDETNTIIPIKEITLRIQQNDNCGIVCLIGVQSNQFPRAADIGRQFCAAGIKVAAGGFHVSGCLSMLPELPPDLVEAQEMGITLFAGEAEDGRLDELFIAAYQDKLAPLYNHMAKLPGLQGQPTPFLPSKNINSYAGQTACFDAGRGCPFTCSFCTIINVQGRQSRFRDADDVERLIRAGIAEGARSFFLTDDNFARNKNWEAIFDRLIYLRENEGIRPHFIIQVDTLCHKIPNFITKAAKAGCTKAYIGLENINPDNLKSASKGQNRITEYRKMLQEWRAVKVITYCGYILGFPDDTPEKIERDLKILKRELPVDILEFFFLTPLPGSEDHQKLYKAGEWMDPDMNKYDLEHAVSKHPLMSKEQWEDIYQRAWDIYYSREHIETLLKRSIVNGVNSRKLARMILSFRGGMLFERVHPLQCGIFRIKDRKQRRYGMKRVNPLLFYPVRAWEIIRTYGGAAIYFLRLMSMQTRLKYDPHTVHYTDIAITPVEDENNEELEMYQVSASAKKAVEKARHRTETVRRAKAAVNA